MFIVVMGVTGSGKTTVGGRLAAELGWHFYEGDDFHPASNVAKMAAGRPLTDDDRGPWLKALCQLIADQSSAGQDGVIACSALKAAYRETLSACGVVVFVYLRATRELVHQRLAQRVGHFMPAGLIESQFEALEEPNQSLTLDASLPAGVLAARIRDGLRV